MKKFLHLIVFIFIKWMLIKLQFHINHDADLIISDNPISIKVAHEYILLWKLMMI